MMMIYRNISDPPRAITSFVGLVGGNGGQSSIPLNCVYSNEYYILDTFGKGRLSEMASVVVKYTFLTCHDDAHFRIMSPSEEWLKWNSLQYY